MEFGPQGSTIEIWGGPQGSITGIQEEGSQGFTIRIKGDYPKGFTTGIKGFRTDVKGLTRLFPYFKT